MSYDIRTIAFLAEVIHPPIELDVKNIKKLHDEIFEDPQISYRNFAMAPDGIHLSNLVDRPGAVSSVSFLPDRVQFREEFTGNTVDEFGTRVKGIVLRAGKYSGFNIAIGHQFVVRSLLNPRYYTDTREFLATGTCGMEEHYFEGFKRPLGLFGLKFVFPQTPEDSSLFTLRIESFNQDPRSLFIENIGTFTHCMIPGEIDKLSGNLEKTYDFLAEKVTGFIAQFDKPAK